MYANMNTRTAAAGKIADFRSDTVTVPGEGMRDAMATAAVGDDVYGEDPTVTALEDAVATRMGKAAGLFLPSGTQSNLAGILSHCGRGEEMISGKDYHVYKYEAGGAATLGGVVSYTIPPEEDGSLDPAAVTAAIKPDDSHFAISRLLCLENTHNGKAIPLAGLQAPASAAREHGLSVHLDGARIFNAAVALKIAPADLVAPVDSVSVCLSKGLGAPVGSVLVGPEDLITRARRWRKMLGGGMRQAGVLAAAGLHALENHVDRLADDHARAKALAEGLADLPLNVDPAKVSTNMVYSHPAEEDHAALSVFMKERGIIIGGGMPVRMVVHLDLDDGDIDRTIDAFRAFYSN